MAATATITHRLTMPKKTSALLTRRAKAEKTTLSKAFTKLVKEHEEMLEDIEDARFAQTCAERHAEWKADGGKFVSFEEAMKLAETIPYTPEK